MERNDYSRQAWQLWCKLQDLSAWLWDAYGLSFAEYMDKEVEEDALLGEADAAWADHLEREGFFDGP